jgi:DNA invertase Pin-like site-specific DNA recombinase
MARERIEMSIQNDILNYKNQGKKQRQVARLLGVNRETFARYWNGSPEEVPQELEWVALLNWDHITDQVEHGGTQKNSI